MNYAEFKINNKVYTVGDGYFEYDEVYEMSEQSAILFILDILKGDRVIKNAVLENIKRWEGKNDWRYISSWQ